MVNNRADAERLVSYAKFPPLGARSWRPRRALPISGLSEPDYLAKANGLVVAFAMIETREGLGNLNDILSTDGIDGVFVGPTDLSVSMSDGKTLASGEVAVAVGRVATAAKDHGKLAGIFAATPALAAEYSRQGFTFMALQQEITFLAAGANAACAELRKALG